MMFARKNGAYTRPVLGAGVDFRMEDMGKLQDVAAASKIINFVAKLPDITTQTGKYAIINMGYVDKITNNVEDIKKLLATNKYLMLPHDPHSPYWSETNSPWWEYAEVMDEYDGILKAAKHPRAGDLGAEEIDERIDEFEENVGKIQALAPSTLEKMMAGAVTESYLRKLRRI